MGRDRPARRHLWEGRRGWTGQRKPPLWKKVKLLSSTAAARCDVLTCMSRKNPRLSLEKATSLGIAVGGAGGHIIGTGMRNAI